MIDYSVLALPKSSRAVEKIQRHRQRDALVRVVNAQVDRRDERRCRFPLCRKMMQHRHHITYRSRVGRQHADNLVSLCAKHHALIHGGLVRVEGPANFVGGNISKLKWALTNLGVQAGLTIPS